MKNNYYFVKTTKSVYSLFKKLQKDYSKELKIDLVGASFLDLLVIEFSKANEVTIKELVLETFNRELWSTKKENTQSVIINQKGKDCIYTLSEKYNIPKSRIAMAAILFGDMRKNIIVRKPKEQTSYLKEIYSEVIGKK